MRKSDKNQGKRHREKILSIIKDKGQVSLAELRKNTTRQAVHYHIPELCKEKLIRPYIKGSGLKDEEIFYTFIQRYERPQDILGLMEEMCDKDTSVAAQACNEFIELCAKKGVDKDSAKTLAYSVMSGAKGFKERLAFHLSRCETTDVFILFGLVGAE